MNADNGPMEQFNTPAWENEQSVEKEKTECVCVRERCVCVWKELEVVKLDSLID